jgi:competence ComEA-like helix-hairpin-helix protein
MRNSGQRSVLLLIALAVLGHGIRLAVTDPGDPPGAVTLLPARDSASLGAHRDRVARLMRPLAQGEHVDVDRAPVQELMRLPRVGPSLAKAIVADREQRGAFGGLEGLDRVVGVGPALLRAVQPFAAFSGSPTAAGPVGGLAGMVDLNRAGVDELQTLPGIGPSRAANLLAYREVHGPFATLESLAGVPGIGPGIVARLRGRVGLP